MSRWAWVRRLRGEPRDRPAQPEPGPSAASPRHQEMQRLRREARQAAQVIWDAPSEGQAEVATYALRKARQRLRELKTEEESASAFEADVRRRPGGCWFPGDC